MRHTGRRQRTHSQRSLPLRPARMGGVCHTKTRPTLRCTTQTHNKQPNLICLGTYLDLGSLFSEPGTPVVVKNVRVTGEHHTHDRSAWPWHRLRGPVTPQNKQAHRDPNHSPTTPERKRSSHARATADETRGHFHTHQRSKTTVFHLSHLEIHVRIAI